ncbi:hypothetical protein B0H11DRAFT_256341 [Mycena galericulata]|nr:hypothetical protein B0H11DRAFT_256341 [Mycena galericulata]
MRARTAARWIFLTKSCLIPLKLPSLTMSYCYRGQLLHSSLQATVLTELVELHARQRTFHGAYGRTALINLGYSLTILRIFDSRFYRIGLLFAVLRAALYVLAFLRSHHPRHDFADYDKPERRSEQPHRDFDQCPEMTCTSLYRSKKTRQITRPQAVSKLPPDVPKKTKFDPSHWVLKETFGILLMRSHGNSNKRPRTYSYIRTSVHITAGWIVIGVAAVVAGVKIGLLVLVLKI